MIPSVSDLPIGKMGTTEIDRFTITPEEALQIRVRQIMAYDTRVIEAGTYTRLSVLAKNMLSFHADIGAGEIFRIADKAVKLNGPPDL